VAATARAAPADPSATEARSRLRGADPDDRMRAATLLGTTGDLSHAGALSEALGDPYPAVREAATGALAHLGAIDSIAAISKLLADETPSCREMARHALEDLAPRPGAASQLLVAMTAPAPIRAGLLPALAASGDERALAALGAAVADEDKTVAAEADRIVRLSPRDRAARAVAGCLDSGPESARVACAAVAGEMRLEAAVPRLASIAGTRADTPEVLAAVRRALAAMRDVLDAGALVQTARTGRTPAERTDALAVLASLRDERGYQALVRALDDPSESVRVAAADGLADQGDRRAVGPLSKAVDKPANARIRRLLARALDRLTGAAPPRPSGG